jgi:small subunit ribosomal protein S1
MVSKQRYKVLEDGPPPLDESWWEAVLAEDEAQYSPSPVKPTPEEDASPNTNSLAHNPMKGMESMDWDKAIDLYEKDHAIELIVNGHNRGGLLVNGKGLQGFVPISHLIEMPAAKADPEEWLDNYIGQTLWLKIIECDPDRGRVVFSERAALAEPGSRNELLENLKPGDCVFGTVTNITDFGVFVDLGGVEGLIHVSEISWGRVRHPSDVVQLGEQLEVHVIQVDQERARVALSLKRLFPNPWETAQDRYFPGQIIEATITSIVPFGAFARLEEGLDGLIHISEICPEDTVTKPEDMLHEGQRVRVRVLHVDGSRQRLGLSMRIEDLN